MQLLRIFILSSCLLWAAQTAFAASPPVNFIANKSVLVDSIDKKDVTKIFKGKTLEWGDGNKIKVILYMNEASHKAFCRFYLKNSPVQLKNSWRKLVFTGKILGDQIKRFKDAEELILYIEKTEHAIGFLPADYKGELPENVKKIKIEEAQ